MSDAPPITKPDTHPRNRTHLDAPRIGLFTLLLSLNALFAQPSPTDNSIKELRVFADSPSPRQVTLSVNYHYNGAAGPIAQLIPVIAKRGENAATAWFDSDSVTVTRGQGPVSAKVRFRGGGPGVPTHTTTDLVMVRMLDGRGRVVLTTAAFPQVITWGSGESGPPAAEPTVAPVAETSAPEARAAVRPKESHQPGFLKRMLQFPWSSKRAKTDLESDAAMSETAEFKQPVGAPQNETEPVMRERPRESSEAPPQTDAPTPAKKTDGSPVSAPAVAKANQPAPSSPPPAETPGAGPKTEPPAQPKLPAAVEQAEEIDLGPAALFQRLTTQRSASGSFGVGPPPRLPEWQERFTLGAGDVLNLSLFGAPETTKTDVFVGPDGRVSFLEAQSVMAAGLTVDELRARMDEVLSKFRRTPRTIISPVAFKSKKYYLLGKVAKPGVFTLEQPLTLIQAVARAGGLETGLTGGNVVELADLSRSFLVRQGTQYAVNFEKLFLEGDLSQNVALEPDDYLYFAASDLREIYVLGEVNNPGPVAFAPDLTAVGAITASRGFSERAWQRRILVVRGSLNHPETFVINVASVLSARSTDFKLRPKDIVYVSHRPWIRAEELLDAAATSFVQAAVVMWTGIHVTPIGR